MNTYSTHITAPNCFRSSQTLFPSHSVSATSSIHKRKHTATATTAVSEDNTPTLFLPSFSANTHDGALTSNDHLRSTHEHICPWC
ncbi:hypothetical protein ACOSP7_001427 [Xanthoceras sorbifolium]